MAQEVRIRPNEILLRRLRPQGSTTDVAGRCRRANSDALSPRKWVDHSGASYSRFPPTTPMHLLEQLRVPSPSSDPEDWLMCWIRAQEAMDLGMIIVADRKEHDPGHCLVDSKLGATKGMWKKLARQTFGRVIDYSAAMRIVTPSDLPGWIE